MQKLEKHPSIQSLYFIHFLDVCHGTNKANINIHQTVRQLSITQKAVSNAIPKSVKANYSHECFLLFMNNWYPTPQLFALMILNFNIRVVVTCKANRKGFDYDKLKIPSNAERGTYKRLVDRRKRIIITRRKFHKTLQTNITKSYFLFHKNVITKRPVCMIWSIEESAKNKVISCSPVKSKARKYSHRVKFRANCTNPAYDIVVHRYNPEGRFQYSVPFNALVFF